MKHFYYKDTFIRANKTYGYHVKEVSVYSIDKDKEVHLIDRIEYTTGSTPGPKQIAFTALGNRGLVAKKYIGRDYYNSGAYKVIKLHELY